MSDSLPAAQPGRRNKEQQYESLEAKKGENNKFLPQALIADDASSFSTTNFNCISTLDKPTFSNAIKMLF